METILENPLLREVHKRYRIEIRERFPEVLKILNSEILCLYKYIRQVPQKFYSETIYGKFLNWLSLCDNNQRTELRDYFKENCHRLNSAFLHLNEINNLSWHDYYEEPDEYEFIRFIDQDVHPAYLRLCEGVLSTFLHIPAYFSRTNRRVSAQGLDIFNIVEELKNSDLFEASSPYRKVIRNGIGHGCVTYLHKEIRYEDRHDNEKYSDSEIVRLFDDLLDSCNALALAVSVFLLSKRNDGYSLLPQIFLSELTETTKTPWWRIVGCTPSEFANTNQLIIYALPRTNDYDKIFMSSFQSGVLAERYMPGYDRYLVSFRNNQKIFGLTSFNGEKLKLLREKKASSIQEYHSVVDSTFCYPFKKTRFKFIKKMQHLIMALKIQMPLAINDFKKEFNLPVISVRNAKIHRNAWGCVLNGSVIIHARAGDIDQVYIRKFKRHIVRNALAFARKNSNHTGVARYLPLGFAHISIVYKDYRRRHLNSFGLRPELVGTIQFQRLRRIRCPDIMGSTVEQKGKYRIAWNRQWIESK